MNHDTNTDGTNEIEVSWTNHPNQTVSITEMERCKNPFCNRLTGLGNDYCDQHSPQGRSDPFKTFDPGRDQRRITNPGPSNREIQRQLDRIEGKLDALLSGQDREDK